MSKLEKKAKKIVKGVAQSFANQAYSKESARSLFDTVIKGVEDESIKKLLEKEKNDYFFLFSEYLTTKSMRSGRDHQKTQPNGRKRDVIPDKVKSNHLLHSLELSTVPGGGNTTINLDSIAEILVGLNKSVFENRKEAEYCARLLISQLALGAEVDCSEVTAAFLLAFISVLELQDANPLVCLHLLVDQSEDNVDLYCHFLSFCAYWDHAASQSPSVISSSSVDPSGLVASSHIANMSQVAAFVMQGAGNVGLEDDWLVGGLLAQSTISNVKDINSLMELWIRSGRINHRPQDKGSNGNSRSSSSSSCSGSSGSSRSSSSSSSRSSSGNDADTATTAAEDGSLGGRLLAIVNRAGCPPLSRALHEALSCLEPNRDALVSLLSDSRFCDELRSACAAQLAAVVLGEIAAAEESTDLPADVDTVSRQAFGHDDGAESGDEEEGGEGGEVEDLINLDRRGGAAGGGSGKEGDAEGEDEDGEESEDSGSGDGGVEALGFTLDVKGDKSVLTNLMEESHPEAREEEEEEEEEEKGGQEGSEETVEKGERALRSRRATRGMRQSSILELPPLLHAEAGDTKGEESKSMAARSARSMTRKGRVTSGTEQSGRPSRAKRSRAGTVDSLASLN
jgi:hypothetical protein